MFASMAVSTFFGVCVRSESNSKHKHKCNMQTAADISRGDEAMGCDAIDLVKYGEEDWSKREHSIAREGSEAQERQ